MIEDYVLETIASYIAIYVEVFLLGLKLPNYAYTSLVLATQFHALLSKLFSVKMIQ